MILSFLFSVLHMGQSKSSSTVNCRKRFVGSFFYFYFLAFPPPQLENMRQILFMYAVTSKGADMLLSLKKNPELFILQKSTRALNWKAPLGPPGRLWELCAALPRLLQNVRQRFLLLNLLPVLREQTRYQSCAFMRNQRAFFLCMNMFFEICFSEVFCTLKYNLNA